MKPHGKRALRAAAQALGLDYVDAVNYPASATGRSDLGRLTITWLNHDHGAAGIRFEGYRIPESLRLEKKRSFGAVFALSKRPPIQTGDSGFDNDVTVHGNAAEVAALLDEQTRRVVRAAVLTDEMGVGSREIRISFRQPVPDVDEITSRAQQLLAIGELLSIDNTAIPQRLLQVALGDEDSSVQAMAAVRLWRAYPRSDQAKRLAQQRLNSTDGRLRLGAARVVSAAKGDPFLLEIVLSDAFDLAERKAALSLLNWRFSVKGFSSELIGLVSAAPNDLLDVLLDALTDNRIAPTLQQLGRSFQASPEAGAAIARSAAIHGVSATPLLLRLLDNDQVRVASCQALETVGDLTAVEPLLRLTKGLFGGSDVKRAARGAVKAIQTRAVMGPVGILSIHEDEPGQWALHTTFDEGEGGLELKEEE